MQGAVAAPPPFQGPGQLTQDGSPGHGIAEGPRSEAATPRRATRGRRGDGTRGPQTTGIRWESRTERSRLTNNCSSDRLAVTLTEQVSRGSFPATGEQRRNVLGDLAVGRASVREQRHPQCPAVGAEAACPQTSKEAPVPMWHRARGWPKATGASMSSLKPAQTGLPGRSCQGRGLQSQRQRPFFRNHSRGLRSLAVLSARLDSTRPPGTSEPSRPRGTAGAPGARGRQGRGGQTACAFCPITERRLSTEEVLGPSQGSFPPCGLPPAAQESGLPLPLLHGVLCLGHSGPSLPLVCFKRTVDRNHNHVQGGECPFCREQQVSALECRSPLTLCSPRRPRLTRRWYTGRVACTSARRGDRRELPGHLDPD